MSMVQNLESGEVLLETETIYPNVTVAQLSETVALRARAVTPIADNSSEILIMLHSFLKKQKPVSRYLETSKAIPAVPLKLRSKPSLQTPISPSP